MKQMFNLNRIKISEILEDASDFIRKVYKQSLQQFTPASPWGQIVMVISRLSQMILYYIEDSITELSMRTASRPESIRGLATLTGHNITRAVSASGTLFLAYNGVLPNMDGNYVIIPNLSRLKCNDNGLEYVAVLGQDQIRMNVLGVREKIIFKILQGVIESQQFTGTGEPIQSFSVFVPSGTNIDNYFVNVFINGEKWRLYDSLQDIPRNEKGCIVRTGIGGGLDVFFGNGNFGMIPEAGSTILIEYLITSGELGNLREMTGVSFEFIDSGKDVNGNDIDLNEIFNIGIVSPINFGSNPEPTFLTRIIAPNQSRSFVYGNTTNYVNLFERMQLFSYIDVYTKFDEHRPWRDLVIYALLLPDIKKRMRSGENYFTVPLKYFTLTDVEQSKLYAMLNESGNKILGTIFYFEQPQFKRYALNIDIISWEGYDKDNIRNEIINKMSEYFAKFKRKDILPKSDLIAIIEAIQGVDSVNLHFVSELVEDMLYKAYDINLIDEIDNSVINVTDKELIKSKYESEAEKKGGPLTNDEKLKILLTYDSVKRYIAKHIDINGDIVTSRNEIPLIRGGWKNRNRKIYYDVLSKEKMSSININFIRQSKEDKIIKSNINSLRR